jgi:N-acetylmuramoyl-L-alanine amidase
MPSVLVEAGFLSNPEEEKFLISDNGQEFIASAIFRAFLSFKKKIESGAKEAIAYNLGIDTQKGKAEKSVTKPVETQKGKAEKSVTKPVETQKGKAEKSVTKPVETQKEIVSGKIVRKPDPPEKTKIQLPLITYRVQFMINPKVISLHSVKFAGLPDVRMYRHQGMFKYTTGEGKTVDEVMKFLEMAKNKGFKDAFIVAFNGDERITIAEAKRMQSSVIQ